MDIYAFVRISWPHHVRCSVSTIMNIMRNSCLSSGPHQSSRFTFWISFVYFPLRSQRRLISHKNGSVSFFRPESPLSGYPLWISQSDDAPWRRLAAVLLSLFRILLSVMQHPAWVQVHQFVFRCLTHAGPSPLFALSLRHAGRSCYTTSWQIWGFHALCCYICSNLDLQTGSFFGLVCVSWEFCFYLFLTLHIMVIVTVLYRVSCANTKYLACIL